MRKVGKYYVACGSRPDGSEFAGQQHGHISGASQEALSFLLADEDGTPPEATMAWIDEIRIKRMFIAERTYDPDQKR